MEKEQLDDAVIDQISGGSLEETREIAEFINAHGGTISYGDTMRAEVNEWLREHCKEIGISRASFTDWHHTENAYGLRDENRNIVVCGQKELMARLRSVYGE